MPKNIIFNFLLIISVHNAENFDTMALVLYDGDNYMRIDPNKLIIINESLLKFKGIDMGNRKIMLIDGDNIHFIFSFNEIKSIRYQKNNQKFVRNGALIGSAIYAYWGILQSSNNYQERHDKNTKVFIFTVGSAGFGGLLGALVSYYPLQNIYNYFKPTWSDALIIDDTNWQIL